MLKIQIFFFVLLMRSPISVTSFQLTEESRKMLETGLNLPCGAALAKAFSASEIPQALTLQKMKCVCVHTCTYTDMCIYINIHTDTHTCVSKIFFFLKHHFQPPPAPSWAHFRKTPHVLSPPLAVQRGFLLLPFF